MPWYSRRIYHLDFDEIDFKSDVYRFLEEFEPNNIEDPLSFAAIQATLDMSYWERIAHPYASLSASITTAAADHATDLTTLNGIDSGAITKDPDIEAELANRLTYDAVTVQLQNDMTDMEKYRAKIQTRYDEYDSIVS